MLPYARTSALLAILLSSMTSGRVAAYHGQFHQHHQETCPQGQELVKLKFRPDRESFLENGWTLQCFDDSTTDATNIMEQQQNVNVDEDYIWNVQPGELEETDCRWLRETSCIPTSSTCVFTFLDTAGNGLQDRVGCFAFKHGTTYLASSKFQQGNNKQAESVCFGPDCAALDLVAMEQDHVDEMNEALEEQEEEEAAQAAAAAAALQEDEDEEEKTSRCIWFLAALAGGLGFTAFALVVWAALRNRRKAAAAAAVVAGMPAPAKQPTAAPRQEPGTVSAATSTSDDDDTDAWTHASSQDLSHNDDDDDDKMMTP